MRNQIDEAAWEKWRPEFIQSLRDSGTKTDQGAAIMEKCIAIVETMPVIELARLGRKCAKLGSVPSLIIMEILGVEQTFQEALKAAGARP